MRYSEGKQVRRPTRPALLGARGRRTPSPVEARPQTLPWPVLQGREWKGEGRLSHGQDHIQNIQSHKFNLIVDYVRAATAATTTTEIIIYYNWLLIQL